MLQAGRQSMASRVAEDALMNPLAHVPETTAEAITLLKSTIVGAVLTAPDARYEAALGTGPAGTSSPVVIVLAASVDDIVQAVRFARAEHLPVAIR
jgi:FAD/FMN-containing dehydrogenase